MIEETLSLIGDRRLRERCARWLAYMESHVDFWPFGGEIHQRRHWARVLVLAMEIGRGEGFSDADLEGLAMAAMFHDTRRRDAFLDRGHGDRGAEHYREFAASHPEVPFDPRAYLAIKWHDRHDEDGIAAIRAWEEARPGERRDDWAADAVAFYRAFKDADGLDRLRMGEWALDESYLRLATSKGLVGFEHRLLDASERLARAIYPAGAPAPAGDAPGGANCDAGSGDGREGASNGRCLVVVDVQNDFVDGALGTPEAQAALPAMVEKVRGFDGQIVFTKDTHDAWYSSTQEGRLLPIAHCLVGTPGWQLAAPLDEIRRERGLPVYWKPTFGSTELARDLVRLRAKGALESVELIGLCTDICVASNALLVKAQMPDLPVYVDAACCAGVTPEKHAAALETMRSCQILVR